MTAPTPSAFSAPSLVISTPVAAATTAASTTPSTPPVTQASISSVQVWTLIVAGVAVIATLVSAWLLRRTGRGTVQAAKQAAAASERSAAAAEKSALAAQEAVGVNRETAIGVATRAEADAFAKRYQEAASQLGHAKAPVRLAGVYAMALLADDWEQQRQQCVDVLCAYLRMPGDMSEDGNRFNDAGDLEVRNSIVRVIGGRLNADALSNWCTVHLDFTDAVIDQLSWQEPSFLAPVTFRRARFLRDIWLSGARFLTKVTFQNTQFDGVFHLSRALLQDGFVQLADVQLNGADISFTRIFPNATFILSRVVCAGEVAISCYPGSAPQGRLRLDGITVLDAATLTVWVSEQSTNPIFEGVKLAGGYVMARPTAQIELPTTFSKVDGSDSDWAVWDHDEEGYKMAERADALRKAMSQQNEANKALLPAFGSRTVEGSRPSWIDLVN